jgi:hypothetical protein
MEDAADLVFVPWDVGWWFYSIGSVGLQYIVKITAEIYSSNSPNEVS